MGVLALWWPDQRAWRGQDSVFLLTHRHIRGRALHLRHPAEVAYNSRAVTAWAPGLSLHLRHTAAE